VRTTDISDLFFQEIFGALLKRCLIFVGMRPSKKSIRRMVDKIHMMTALKTAWQETTELVGRLQASATFTNARIARSLSTVNAPMID
jgi:hypothetical protein